MKRILTWIIVGVLSIVVGHWVLGRLRPAKHDEDARGAVPALVSSPEHARARVDRNPYIDVPTMPIGRLAMLYARREGYVVCDDLLRDQRVVSVQFAIDSPVEMARLFAVYGYDVVQRGAGTYLCGRTDPFAGVQVWISGRTFYRGSSIYGGLDAQPYLEWMERGRLVAWPLATIASAHGLEVQTAGCSYSLVRPGGSVVRVLADPLCLAQGRSSASTIPATGTSGLSAAPIPAPDGYHPVEGRADAAAPAPAVANLPSAGRTSG